MRESQMKKIIAAAVAAAFVAPAFAADVTISGAQEFSYTDSNGATETAIDGHFSVAASTETANGLSVSANIDLDNEGGEDGGNSLKIGGDFGSLTLGDTSSAADSVDDRTDYDKVLGLGTTAGDAGVGWTLPSMVPGLKVYVSYGADTDEETDSEAHTGVALSYATGPVSIAWAENNNDDGTKITYVGGTATFGGIAVSVERMEDDADDTKESAVGVKYGMGDVTLYAAVMDTKTGGTLGEDQTAVGLQYSLGGGVTAFVENRTDDVDASDATAAGIEFKF
jgi:hypothetical protein